MFNGLTFNCKKRQNEALTAIRKTNSRRKLKTEDTKIKYNK